MIFSSCRKKNQKQKKRKVCKNILGGIGKNGYFCGKLDSMAVELQQTVSRIAAKSRIILERYELMKRQLKASAEKIDQLEHDLGRIRAENERLRSQVDYLKIAAVVAPEREDVERTRTLLSNLVREIDKCIADLND